MCRSAYIELNDDYYDLSLRVVPHSHSRTTIVLGNVLTVAVDALTSTVLHHLIQKRRYYLFYLQVHMLNIYICETSNKENNESSKQCWS